MNKFCLNVKLGIVSIWIAIILVIIFALSFKSLVESPARTTSYTPASYFDCDNYYNTPTSIPSIAIIEGIELDYLDEAFDITEVQNIPADITYPTFVLPIPTYTVINTPTYIPTPCPPTPTSTSIPVIIEDVEIYKPNPTITSTPSYYEWYLEDNQDIHHKNPYSVPYQGHSQEGEWIGCLRGENGKWLRIDDLPCKPLDDLRKEREKWRIDPMIEVTPTYTAVPTVTPIPTATIIPTQCVWNSPMPPCVPHPTITPIIVPTATIIPATVTPIATITPSPIITVIPTPTVVVNVTVTVIPTVLPTQTVIPTSTVLPISTSPPVPTIVPTSTLVPINTVVPTQPPVVSTFVPIYNIPTPKPTNTVVPTATLVPTTESTPTVIPTSTPTPKIGTVCGSEKHRDEIHGLHSHEMTWGFLFGQLACISDRTHAATPTPIPNTITSCDKDTTEQDIEEDNWYLHNPGGYIDWHHHSHLIGCHRHPSPSPHH